MSDPFSNKEEAVPVKTSSPKLLQFSLLTIMLLTATVGVWAAHIQTTDEIEQMRLEIPNLQNAARELIITDPNLYTAVRHHETWFNEFRWRIYLPEGHQYQLALATEKIDTNTLATPSDTQIIAPGEYELELLYYRKPDKSFRIAVLLNEEVIFEQLHPAGWHNNSGSTGSTNISDSVQRNLDVPFEIMRTRFHQLDQNRISRMPKRPCKGILIWLNTLDN